MREQRESLDLHVEIRVELGLGFGFPRLRASCARGRFYNWISNRLSWHTHTGTHALGIEKHLKFNGGCLYALWAHGTDQSRLERERGRESKASSSWALYSFFLLLLFFLTAPCGIPRKQKNTDPLNLLAKCKVGIKGHTQREMSPGWKLLKRLWDTQMSEARTERERERE